MAFESYYKEKEEKLNEAIILFKEQYPETKNNHYPVDLLLIFQKYIEVYGHGYCMDMVGERRKISKLLYELLYELKS